MNVGLLLLRLLLTAMLLGHSTQKLLGWFQGIGLTKTAAVFEGWGFRPGVPMVITAGCCETIGAGSLSLGLLTPAGCAVVIGTMSVAAAPNAVHGFWAHLGGCEVPVVYAGIAVVLAFTGPGRFSLDHALGLGGLRDVRWSIAAVVVGIVAAVPPLLRRRAVLHAETATVPTSR
jgi:putative oxidoreductase